MQLTAADWHEYRRMQDAQNRRYERAGVGGGKEEHDQYFGRGEYRGTGAERKLNPQDWIRWSRQPTFDDLPQHEREWHRGYELGENHGHNAEHADFDEADHEAARSSHPDHFSDGYTEGLNTALAFPKVSKKAAIEPLSTPEDVVAHETGTQHVQNVGGRTLCPWHRDRVLEQQGLSSQIAEETGLGSGGASTASPPYQGRCEECTARQRNRPWESAPGSPNFRPRHLRPIEEERMPDRPSKHVVDYRPKTPQHLSSSGSVRYVTRTGQGRLPRDASRLQRLAHQISADMPDLIKLGHDSGDGMTIFHCPFCGSGQVIARSDGSVNCEFCQASYSVTVQPQYPAFPQTINGQPVDVPGMGPTWGDPAGNAVDPEQAPGEDGGSGDNPFDQDSDEDTEGDQESGDSDMPEGLSKKTYLTATGSRLDKGAYMRHLALQFTHDPEQTLKLIRQASSRKTALDVPTHVHVGDGEHAKVITEEHARGDSRPVGIDEFTRVATKGKQIMDAHRAAARHPVGLHDDDSWNKIKEHTYNEIHKPWGGSTINAHTGEPLASDADAYAVTVKPPRTDSVMVHERPSRQEWSDAMDTARSRFHDTLRNRDHHLGVFHDDDLGRVDIDPVLVTKHRHEAEAIGAYTHNIGGAYNFSDGNGYWPPHVKQGKTAAQGDRGAPLPFKGIGHWYASAAALEGAQ